MKTGTKSILFGAHCFCLHPWFVALAWWRLYGFPCDPRLWVAFFVHDLGYIGKPNMDGPEGETHPEFGALVMLQFDVLAAMWRGTGLPTNRKWFNFALYHSRYYAKAQGAQPSRLCFADKLSFVLMPRWLYLPMARATGELDEYLSNAQRAEDSNWTPPGYEAELWHDALCKYLHAWVEAHKDGSEDTWTAADRYAEGGATAPIQKGY